MSLTFPGKACSPGRTAIPLPTGARPGLLQARPCAKSRETKRHQTPSGSQVRRHKSTGNHKAGCRICWNDCRPGGPGQAAQRNAEGLTSHKVGSRGGPAGRAELPHGGMEGNSICTHAGASATCLSPSPLGGRGGPTPSLPSPTQGKNLRVKFFLSYLTSHIQSVGTPFKIKLDSVCIYKTLSKMHTLKK